jgi:hypothetical protein
MAAAVGPRDRGAGPGAGAGDGAAMCAYSVRSMTALADSVRGCEQLLECARSRSEADILQSRYWPKYRFSAFVPSPYEGT